jgi:hypothetical protein
MCCPAQQEMFVQTEFKLRRVLPYVSAVGLGMVLAKVAPLWLLLPAFFASITCVAILTFVAHRSHLPLPKNRTLGFSLVLVTVLFGPAGIQAKDGLAPRLFIMSLLFVFGFILVLGLTSGAA